MKNVLNNRLDDVGLVLLVDEVGRDELLAADGEHQVGAAAHPLAGQPGHGVDHRRKICNMSLV